MTWNLNLEFEKHISHSLRKHMTHTGKDMIPRKEPRQSQDLLKISFTSHRMHVWVYLPAFTNLPQPNVDKYIIHGCYWNGILDEITWSTSSFPPIFWPFFGSSLDLTHPRRWRSLTTFRLVIWEMSHTLPQQMCVCFLHVYNVCYSKHIQRFVVYVTEYMFFPNEA